jgi:hypothetical protein
VAALATAFHSSRGGEKAYLNFELKDLDRTDLGCFGVSRAMNGFFRTARAGGIRFSLWEKIL